MRLLVPCNARTKVHNACGHGKLTEEAILALIRLDTASNNFSAQYMEKPDIDQTQTCVTRSSLAVEVQLWTLHGT